MEHTRKKETLKHRMATAFLVLLTKKTYLDITVTDIVCEAEVARASFYRNFGGIADVIDYIITEMFEKLLEDIFPIVKGCDESEWRDFLRKIFESIEKERTVMTDIGFHNLSIIFSRIDQRARAIERNAPQEDLREKYIVGAKLGIVMGVSKRWINSGMKESIDEMIDFLVSIVMF